MHPFSSAVADFCQEDGTQRQTKNIRAGTKVWRIMNVSRQVEWRLDEKEMRVKTYKIEIMVLLCLM